MGRRGTLLERFLRYVIPEPMSGCWLWVGALKENEYGAIGLGGREAGMEYAHRVSWMLFSGPIPGGQQVLHKCDVRPCVNPDHLFLGTIDDNLKDCASKGRMHNGELNGMSKLTIAEVRQIRYLLESSITHAMIAAKFGVARQTIGKIANGKKWKRVA